VVREPRGVGPNPPAEVEQVRPLGALRVGFDRGVQLRGVVRDLLAAHSDEGGGDAALGGRVGQELRVAGDRAELLAVLLRAASAPSERDRNQRGGGRRPR
jgi:hypothetical protein